MICPACNREISKGPPDAGLLKDGKCGWCHMEEQGERDRAEFAARLADDSWNGIAGERARYERTQRLAATDWTQLPDVPANVRAAWAPYRAALRDMPQTQASPKQIKWPEPPSADKGQAKER